MSRRNTYFKLSWGLILVLAAICISYPGSKPAYLYKGINQAHACDGGGDGEDDLNGSYHETKDDPYHGAKPCWSKYGCEGRTLGWAKKAGECLGAAKSWGLGGGDCVDIPIVIE